MCIEHLFTKFELNCYFLNSKSEFLASIKPTVYNYHSIKMNILTCCSERYLVYPLRKVLFSTNETMSVMGTGCKHKCDMSIKYLLFLLFLLPVYSKAQVAIITTVAGNGTAGFTGIGGPAIATELHLPEGVALDSAGNIYIADVNNNCIRKVNSSGIINTAAGICGGSGGFSGDGGACYWSLIKWS